MSNQRLFVAIELPEPVRRRLAAVAPVASGVRVTKADNLHLTLHFIGNASLEVLRPALVPISESTASFTLELSGVGHFSSRGKPVIFWAGVELSAELARLHAEVGRLLAAAGLAVESRPYCPHITIARGERVKRSVIDAFLRMHSHASATVAVNAIALVSSTPQPGGSVYLIEQRYMLTRDGNNGVSRDGAQSLV